jgi:glutathione synthase/RimK-type ligase-like ATP-grasp enzyme
MEAGIRFRISLFHSPDRILRIHPSHGQHLPPSLRHQCSCVCGPHSIAADLVLDRQVPQETLSMSDALFTELMAEANPEWVTAELTDTEFRFGPTIGILCHPRWDDKKGELRQTRQLPGLLKMVEAGTRQGALVYLFAIQDVDFAKWKVKGYVWADGGWTQAWLPFPDVIYDQVVSRKVERNPKYLQERKRLSQLYGDRIFNDGFFDKSQVHDWLTADHRTRPYLPHTVQYSQSRDLVQFLRHHSVVFIKPVHGSLGLGIVRVSRQADGSFAYELKRPGGRISGKAADPEGVVEALRGRLKSKPYLIQEGIPLAQYNRRPFDLRIVLQRDGRGVWMRTKMFARVAQPGDFTSNVSSGGEALSVSEVLRSLYPDIAKRKQCQRLIRRVSRLVPDVIEEQSGKTFGELGIDVGLDGAGHVWVIEVNAKPWKSPTTDKGRQDLVDLAFMRPMEYALQLAQLK